MTVSTTTSRVSYSGNGSTVTFIVPFYFIDSGDLKVYLTSSTNVQTEQYIGTNYTVTGAGVISGGSITFTTAPSSDYTIIIYRDPATTQLVDYQANDPFPAETHERALDKLTMLAQRLSDVNDRSIHLSDGDASNASTELSSPLANYLIGWNSTGDALQNVDPATLATVVSYATAHADTFTGDGTTTSWTLSANPGVLYNLDVSINGVTQVPVIDYTYSGTTFTTTTAAPLNSVILVKYKEGLPNYSGDSQDIRYLPSGGTATTVQTKLRETVSVKDFGADPTGATSSNIAFTNAIATGHNVLVPDGSYLLGTTISLQPGQIIYGRRYGAKIYKNANVPMFFIPSASSGAGLKGLSLYGNYDGFGFGIPGRPGAAASFTDTTDNIQVGVTGTEGPYFWVLEELDSQYAGRHGLYWFDGPSPVIKAASFSTNAGWGFYQSQTQVVGGPAVDVHHATILSMECTNNGKSSLSEGGGAYIKGSSHSVVNLKCFGSYGDGLTVNATASKIAAFVEQNGSANSSITTWAAGQSVTIGTFRKYQTNLYVATTSGTTGSTAPTFTSGTGSDGAVTWQYRGGLNLRVESNTWDMNEIYLLWNDGYYNYSGNNYVETITQATANSYFGKTQQILKTLTSTRALDFQKVGGSGAYETLSLQPKVSGANNEWQLTGDNGSSTLHDLYFGVSGGKSMRLRGGGVGSVQDIAIGGKVLSVSANYSLFNVDAAVADTIFVDTSAGNVEINLWNGGDNSLAGRKITIVKTTSANTLKIYGNGTYNGASFAYPGYSLTTQWSYTELIMSSTTGPTWFKKV